MRVAIYARVSTSDRDQDPTTQLLPLREFCKAQGWGIEGEYVDKASANDLRGRKAWRVLLKKAAQRHVDLVLVWKMDRAWRSVLDAATTLQQLRSWGVGLRSYSEPYLDTTSPFGEVLFTILVGFAQLERSMISERVRAGMARARTQGKRLGRPSLTGSEDVARRWTEIEPRLRSGELSKRQAAGVLGVSRSTVMRWVSRNGGPNGWSETSVNMGSFAALTGE